MRAVYSGGRHTLAIYLSSCCSWFGFDAGAFAGHVGVCAVVGRDPVTGNSVQRSFRVRGDAAHPEAVRRELVVDHGIGLSVLQGSGDGRGSF